jgi:hypothetical protein
MSPIDVFLLEPCRVALGRSDYFNNQRMDGKRVVPLTDPASPPRITKRTDLHLRVEDLVHDVFLIAL